MILLLMIMIPLLLYMGLKARMRKAENWKYYLCAAGGVFIILAIVAKT